jgi:hypothetical protein
MGRSASSDHGGHFFLSKYGIRVHGAANTLVVWKPYRKHGTSLQRLSPSDPQPPFIQTGMSIVTSNRIAGVWQKYMDEGLEAISEFEGGEIFEDWCISCQLIIFRIIIIF